MRRRNPAADRDPIRYLQQHMHLESAWVNAITHAARLGAELRVRIPFPPPDRPRVPGERGWVDEYIVLGISEVISDPPGHGWKVDLVEDRGRFGGVQYMKTPKPYWEVFVKHPTPRRNPADADLRALERRFRETGSVQDEEAWAQAMIRAGTSSLETEIAMAVIRRGPLMNTWQPEYEYPGFLVLYPPFRWGQLFAIYAHPYFNDPDVAHVTAQVTSAGTECEFDHLVLGEILLPQDQPVVELAERWRSGMTTIVSNLASILIARQMGICTCNAEPAWPAPCPGHAVEHEALGDLIYHMGHE